MGLLAAWDRAIARSAYEGGKRQDAEVRRLIERDTQRRQERIAAGLEQPMDCRLYTPDATRQYNLVSELKTIEKESN